MLNIFNYANISSVTGYTKGTIDNGKPVSVGVITDFVDSKLTDFIKKVITKVNLSSHVFFELR